MAVDKPCLKLKYIAIPTTEYWTGDEMRPSDYRLEGSRMGTFIHTFVKKDIIDKLKFVDKRDIIEMISGMDWFDYSGNILSLAEEDDYYLSYHRKVIVELKRCTRKVCWEKEKELSVDSPVPEGYIEFDISKYDMILVDKPKRVKL